MSENHVEALQREIERLEREANWLAQAAANAGWYGIRVSAKDMREEAKRATGGENVETGPEFPRAVRTCKEVARVEQWARDIDTEGSHYDMKCYEEGVLDTLEWLRGDTDVAPYEAE